MYIFNAWHQTIILCLFVVQVLPFVQKLLECCKDSKIFKPTNPMIAGILGVLAELHGIKGLKINNIFSIELVFKAFNLSPAEVKPTDILRNLPRERLQNPDWSVEALPQEAPPPPVHGDAKQGQAQSIGSPSLGQPTAASSQQSQSAIGARPGMSSTDAKSSSMQGAGDASSASPSVQSAVQSAPVSALDQGLLAQLHNYVVINPSLTPLAERLQLKRHVPTCVDRAIFEILSPVVERYVSVPLQSGVFMVKAILADTPSRSHSLC